MGLRHSTPKSFGYAFEGIKIAFRNEPNMKIHVFMAFLALFLAIFLGLSKIEWLFLLFTIVNVLTLELLNTVLEAVVNLVSPQIKPHAKIAKDVSAAMVLLSAILSVVVGLVLFLPKILALV